MSEHEVVPSDPDHVQELPHLSSPTLLESQRTEVLESHFQDILQRLWACNGKGHGLCYHRPGRDEHVPINKDALDSWVQQICRGFAACIEPPQGLLSSSWIEEGMSDFERDAITMWFSPFIRNTTEVEVGPGYLCGLALERIGTKLHQDIHFGWEVLAIHATCGGVPKSCLQVRSPLLKSSASKPIVSGASRNQAEGSA
ncbi:hypothetical protein BU17DRAFT_72125 [Hysterangium stoloniferum]|nr:hypothetical protein BU17DRAFT_72125 [Hysterangium stoloniferum]